MEGALLAQPRGGRQKTQILDGRTQEQGLPRASWVKAGLITAWEASGQIWSKRLVPFLPKLVDALERHGKLWLTEVTMHLLLNLCVVHPACQRSIRCGLCRLRW